MLLTNSALLRMSFLLIPAWVAVAQPPPPMYPPAELDRLVQRIALYPDPLLAQVLAASTYWDQIPEADMWANQHKYLRGDQLAAAIAADRLPWDPAVQAILPFPNILHMMNSDMAWTQAVGTAFLNQNAGVMDAVQRDRQIAYGYGYLRSNAYYSVAYAPRMIVINPINPGLIYVPAYDPLVVYARPRAGFVVGGAITFGAGFAIGAAFAPWGWGGVHFGWGEHTVIIHDHPWARTYVNRTTYVHPYSAPRYDAAHRAPETHRLEEHHDERREEHRGR